MVAGSATTRGVATLLACATGAAGTIPLFAELHGVGTDVEEPAAKPYGVEEGPDDWQADHGEYGPEERTRDPWDLVHVSNNAQGW
jgi:hypothetical protein